MSDTLQTALLVASCLALAIGSSHLLVLYVIPERLTRREDYHQRHVAIDGIRGFLALGVYIHHCFVTTTFAATGFWMSPPSNFKNELGKLSVAVFFMITSFLFWSRARANWGMSWKAFFITRAFRIYPMFLFLLALVCAIVARDSRFYLREPGLALARELENWLLFRTPDINRFPATYLIFAGVLWTLPYEVWFYLSLPLLAAVFVRKNALWERLVALVMFLVLFDQSPVAWGVVELFLGGIFAAYFTLNKFYVKAARTWVGTLVAIACLGYVGGYMAEPFSDPGLVAVSIFFAIIASGNTLFGVLRSRAALWLGEISYGLYLSHGIFLWWLTRKILVKQPPLQHPILWLTAFAGTVVFVVGFSSACHIYIERPFIAFGHRFARRVTGPRI